jgi:hypothetical protein
MDDTVPRAGGEIDKFLGDQPIAFDGQFHRLGAFGPKVGFVHKFILSISSGKDASTRVAMQHGMEAEPIQPKNPPVASADPESGLITRGDHGCPTGSGILPSVCGAQ